MLNESDTASLVRAVRAWTGWGNSMIPKRDDAAVKSSVGTDAAGRLLPILDALAEDFYSTDARFAASDLAEMGKMAASQFRAKYPNLPAEIAEAFAWCYTFDFK